MLGLLTEIMFCVHTDAGEAKGLCKNGFYVCWTVTSMPYVLLSTLSTLGQGIEIQFDGRGVIDTFNLESK
jgi:hypothetical protein